MTADTRTTRPGALALDYLTAEVERRTGNPSFCITDQREADAALADLRALIARCEAAERDANAHRIGMDAAVAKSLEHAHALVESRARCEAAERERDNAKRHAEALAAALDVFAAAELAYEDDMDTRPTLMLARSKSRAALAAYRAERGK